VLRRVVIVLLAALLVAFPGAVAATAGGFTYRGDVVRVVDGDTIDVVLDSGKRERVRLIGIDAPERGACYAAKAASRARELALDERVVLKGDPTQDTRDRYGRLLAYVWIPGGKDLGYQLIAGGFAEVYVFERPFQRLGAYQKAERVAGGGPLGIWGSCVAASPSSAPSPAVSPPPPAGGGNCDSNYSGYCVPDVSYDLDCADIGYNTVRVVGTDVHRFDGDGDGFGCE
jgi:micrococcal nuclease